MKTLLLAGGASLLAILAAFPAAANPLRPYIIEQVEVRHGDLDLATGSGARTMLERLSAAASDACGGRPRPGFSAPHGPSKQRAWRLCKVAAIDFATQTLDAELVRALWLGNEEAIRYGAQARRMSVELYRQAGLDAPAAPARGG
jgi:UrcA family protein